MPENENKPIDSNSLHNTTIETAVPRPSAPSESHEVRVKHTSENHHESAEPAIHEPIDTTVVEEEKPVTPTTPPPAKTEEPSKKVVAEDLGNQNTPGTLVLQWLTYVFWGWTNLVLIWLTFIVSGYIMKATTYSDDDTYFFFAAAFVLLPLSIICEVLYRRKEPMHKTGGATILMILHAVIFAIFGIGALITFAYSVVQLMLSPTNDLSSIYSMMLTAIIVAILYAAVFLRTLNPFKKKYTGILLSVFMFIVTTTLIALNLVGPTQLQRLHDQDNQTHENVTQLAQSISDYADEHYALPAALTDKNFDGNENPLVTDNAVTYTRTSTNTLNPPAISQNDTYRLQKLTPQDNDPTHLFFTLCVTYKADAQNSSYDYTTTREEKKPQPSSDFYAPTNHKEGKNCYLLYAQPQLSSAEHNNDEY